jgi:hypothetical protein
MRKLDFLALNSNKNCSGSSQDVSNRIPRYFPPSIQDSRVTGNWDIPDTIQANECLLEGSAHHPHCSTGSLSVFFQCSFRTSFIFHSRRLTMTSIGMLIEYRHRYLDSEVIQNIASLATRPSTRDVAWWALSLNSMATDLRVSPKKSPTLGHLGHVQIIRRDPKDIYVHDDPWPHNLSNVHSCRASRTRRKERDDVKQNVLVLYPVTVLGEAYNRYIPFHP